MSSRGKNKCYPKQKTQRTPAIFGRISYHQLTPAGSANTPTPTILFNTSTPQHTSSTAVHAPSIQPAHANYSYILQCPVECDWYGFNPFYLRLTHHSKTPVLFTIFSNKNVFPDEWKDNRYITAVSKYQYVFLSFLSPYETKLGFSGIVETCTRTLLPRK